MPDYFYVYPAYIARGRSRSEGRRIPEGLALSELTAEEIVQAAKRLGFRAEVEIEKQFPHDVPAYLGRVKVMKSSGMTKGKFLRAVATELSKQRAAGGKR